MSYNFRWAVWLALVMVHTVAGSALATIRFFTVDTDQSNIATSGTVTFSGVTANFQPQGTGSLTTNYSGTIDADRVGNSILFMGDVVSANVNGNWKPDANANNNAQAADYGAKVTSGPETINIALRQLNFEITSGDITPDSSGHFDLSAATLAFASGNLAYRDTGGLQVGNFDLSGGTAALTGTGSLISEIGQQTIEHLTIPINSTFVVKPNTTTTVNLTLTGQLVATSTFFTPLPGDYNGSGTVDFADYDVWRGAFGIGTPLQYNDDTEGVESDDYVRWRAHLGQTTIVGGAAIPDSSAAVPEPSSGLMLLTILGSLQLRRQVRRNASA